MLPGPRTLIGRALRLPLRLVPELKPLPIVSGPLRGKRWLSTSGTHGCWLGTYESDLQALIVSCIKPGQVFYDIGANVGFFSLLASMCVGTNGQVVAFEPLPRNLELLRANLALNSVGNAKVLPSAVADAAGSATFSDEGSPSMGRMGASRGITVPVVSIDDLVAQDILSPPDVIKMDIEGAESLALAGASTTLSVHRPLVLLSTHGFQQHEACCAMLERIGYSVRLRRDGAQDGQYELVATPN